MRPVLPILTLAVLIALPAAAAGHHHAAKAHAAQGATGAGAGGPSALAVPYDYGTDALSAKSGPATTTTTTSGKAAKASQDDLASLTGVPASGGAARKHGKAQALPAY